MKIKVLSVLFAGMLSTVIAFAGDDVINGTWAGFAATDQGGAFFITVNMQNETAGTGVMNWGSGQCSGSLSGGAEGNNAYTYQLRITDGGATTPEGTDGCVDGKVRMVVDGARKLQYTWSAVNPAGLTLTATAVLEKKSLE